MSVIGRANRIFDLLVGVELVIAQWNVMVPSSQQMKDVDIVIAGLRPVDKPARACPLAQRIIDTFRIVGKHAERAIAAHHCHRAGKTFHQDRRHLLLARRRPVVGPARGHLVNVVDGAKADSARIENV